MFRLWVGVLILLLLKDFSFTQKVIGKLEKGMSTFEPNNSSGSTNARAANTKSWLDRNAILARLQDDEDLLRELIELFLEDTPRLLLEAEAALIAGDAGRLQRAAHTIKGSVSNFGATDAVDAAYKLELAAKAGNLADSATLQQRLKQQLACVQTALPRLLLQPAG
jgi:HPt (histidine-containing phosphotransfer) domain-containing protein